MRDFLIDTNIWGYWFDPQRYPEEHRNIEKRVNELPAEAKIRVSVITWGEICVGLNESMQDEYSVQVRHLQFIRAKKPWVEGINTHTAEEYGKLRGRLGPIALQRKKRLTPEERVDRGTWLELGSLENDLWITAQAITKHLTLVTNDELKEIREVAGNDLHIENWAKFP
jgi:predicted nucleic acid-binding protein